MPRKPRIIIEDGIYHVYNRANNRRTIHLDDQTFEYFLSLLKDMNVIFRIRFFSYCVMKNHYHIFLQTPLPNLNHAMKYFGENYARYINKKTNGSGPVFTSRYKSKIVTEDAYALQVARYIHLNPVEAGTVKDFSDYEWSSARDYLRTREPGSLTLL